MIKQFFISLQALCTTSAPIQNGTYAVSCACDAIPFNGIWEVDWTNFANNSNRSLSDSLGSLCFDSDCASVSSGVLASQSLVCYGTDVTLSTYQANITFHIFSESCVNVNTSVIPGRVFSRPTQSPLALSFFQTNFDLVNGNPYAVVTNKKGVTVGQINSDMIQIIVNNFSFGDYEIRMDLCLLYDNSMGGSDEYDHFDLGILSKNGAILPMGLMTSYTPENINGPNSLVCFSNVNLSSSNMSLTLVTRLGNYETFRAYTKGQQDIVIASGSLFCFGAILVTFFHSFAPFNIAVFTIWIQSFCLLSLRGIYFFLLAFGVFTAGGLTDFILIEIPTFIYIGIFFQIILVADWLFFRSDKVSHFMLVFAISIAFLVNWIVFAAIVIALNYSDSLNQLDKYCDCQLSDPVTQSDTSQIIRIVYKSVVVTIALFVVLVTMYFGSRHKITGIQSEYFRVLGLSLGLLSDCIAFLVYYSLNSPSAYFLIVLWFTELLPICVVFGMTSWGYLRHGMIEYVRNFRGSEMRK